MLPEKLRALGFIVENGVLKGATNFGCTFAQDICVTVTTAEGEAFRLEGVTSISIGTVTVSGRGSVGIDLH